MAAVVNGHRLGLPVINKASQKEVDWALQMIGTDLARRPLSETPGGEQHRLLLAQVQHRH